MQFLILFGFGLVYRTSKPWNRRGVPRSKPQWLHCLGTALGREAVGRVVIGRSFGVVPEQHEVEEGGGRPCRAGPYYEGFEEEHEEGGRKGGDAGSKEIREGQAA